MRWLAAASGPERLETRLQTAKHGVRVKTRLGVNASMIALRSDECETCASHKLPAFREIGHPRLRIEQTVRVAGIPPSAILALITHEKPIDNRSQRGIRSECSGVLLVTRYLWWLNHACQLPP